MVILDSGVISLILRAWDGKLPGRNRSTFDNGALAGQGSVLHGVPVTLAVRIYRNG